ncbi:hypothetical protein, partial [Streptococcus anginosus]|uniref:hypothetical protein n=1 Tax=Streptococcus anginosus TaxID=1328 RepID=UPI002000DF54
YIISFDSCQYLFSSFFIFLNFFFQFDSWKHLFVKEVPMAKKYELLILEMSYEMDTIIKKRKQVTGNQLMTSLLLGRWWLIFLKLVDSAKQVYLIAILTKARKTINPNFSSAYQNDNFTTLMIKFNRKTLKFYKEKPIYTLDENDFLG